MANSAAAVVGGSTTATNTNTLASTATPSKTAAKLRFVVPERSDRCGFRRGNVVIGK